MVKALLAVIVLCGCLTGEEGTERCAEEIRSEDGGMAVTVCEDDGGVGETSG